MIGGLASRVAIARVPLPRALAGRRCLHLRSADDRYWTGELERRGAVEVVTLAVEEIETLDPAVTGHFDVVLVGALHRLDDRADALDRVRAVCGGIAVVATTVDPRPWRWLPDRGALVRDVTATGLVVERVTRIYLAGRPHVAVCARRSQRP